MLPDEGVTETKDSDLLEAETDVEAEDTEEPDDTEAWELLEPSEVGVIKLDIDPVLEIEAELGAVAEAEEKLLPVTDVERVGSDEKDTDVLEESWLIFVSETDTELEGETNTDEDSEDDNESELKTEGDGDWVAEADAEDNSEAEDDTVEGTETELDSEGRTEIELDTDDGTEDGTETELDTVGRTELELNTDSEERETDADSEVGKIDEGVWELLTPELTELKLVNEISVGVGVDEAISLELTWVWETELGITELGATELSLADNDVGVELTSVDNEGADEIVEMPVGVPGWVVSMLDPKLGEMIIGDEVGKVVREDGEADEVSTSVDEGDVLMIEFELTGKLSLVKDEGLAVEILKDTDEALVEKIPDDLDEAVTDKVSEPEEAVSEKVWEPDEVIADKVSEEPDDEDSDRIWEEIDEAVAEVSEIRDEVTPEKVWDDAEEEVAGKVSEDPIEEGNDELSEEPDEAVTDKDLEVTGKVSEDPDEIDKEELSEDSNEVGTDRLADESDKEATEEVAENPDEAVETWVAELSKEVEGVAPWVTEVDSSVEEERLLEIGDLKVDEDGPSLEAAVLDTSDVGVKVVLIKLDASVDELDKADEDSAVDDVAEVDEVFEEILKGIFNELTSVGFTEVSNEEGDTEAGASVWGTEVEPLETGVSSVVAVALLVVKDSEM